MTKNEENKMIRQLFYKMETFNNDLAEGKLAFLNKRCLSTVLTKLDEIHELQKEINKKIK